MSLINHLSIPTKDYDKSLIFYKETLSIIGDCEVKQFEYPPHISPEGVVYFSGAKFFTIKFSNYNTPTITVIDTTYPVQKDDLVKEPSYEGLHFAFNALSRQMVDKWHAHAILAGGIDNGAPGQRPMYGPSYYGGFIKDPSGINLQCCVNTYSSI